MTTSTDTPQGHALAVEKFGPTVCDAQDLKGQVLWALHDYEAAQATLEDTTERAADLEKVATETRAGVLERLVSGGIAATPAEKAAKLDPSVKMADKVAADAAREKRQADTRLSIARNRLAVARDLFRAAAGLRDGAQ